MTSFDRSWSNQRLGSTNDKLKEALIPQSPLKPRIEIAINKLQLQISKLDALIAKMNDRDASLFRKVVDSMQRHDSDSAKVFSNELAEVRKVSKTLSQARTALDQVSLRLSTIHDMGDAMVVLGPAMLSIKGLKTSLGRFVPGADTEITNLQALLNSIMVDSVQNGTGVEISAGYGDDIEQIMMEASSLAEERINEKIPSIPTRP